MRSKYIISLFRHFNFSFVGFTPLIPLVLPTVMRQDLGLRQPFVVFVCERVRVCGCLTDTLHVHQREEIHKIALV